MTKINENKLPIIIGSLALITLIAIIYAAFTGQMQINGTSNIRDSKWDIHFTDISSAITTGTAKEITAPTINQEHPNTINDYEVSLTTPGDSISYELEVTNEGDYDAILTDYTINAQPICKVGNNTDAKSAQDVCEYLEYKITYKGGALLQKNVDVLNSKEKAIFVITLTYKEFNDSSKLPTENVSIEGLQVSVTYSQGNNKAKVNPDGTTPYVKEYSVGDEITVAGEQYYVISDSNYNQDYVTALKANPLTVEEVSTYGIINGVNYINKKTYTSVGTVYNQNGYGGMAYYSSEQCGYLEEGGTRVQNGCKNEDADNYDTSDIKFVIDYWANDKFLHNELKIVDGYSVRLITQNDLNNLNCINYSCANAPNWISNNDYYYWTMVKYRPEYDGHVLCVTGTYRLNNCDTDGQTFYKGPVVRPVINVYKNKIENN